MDPFETDSKSLIGESPTFLDMLEHVSIAAKLAKPVLVIGERGTGKELITARLHYLSERWEQKFIRVNCAALTESLLETELFGHEAGAFTGATRTHIGCFEQAESGTLVLDELGTIPLRMQEKILRVIEYGEFRRVGGTKTLTSFARIVGSTNENLPELARQGQFRSDLLDRLAFDVIHVPPLRARPEDIGPLAYHFAVNITSELGREFFPGFSREVEEQMLTHDWPGNVRELKYTVERSIYRNTTPSEPIAALFFDPFKSPYAPKPLGRPGNGRDASRADAITSAVQPRVEWPIDFRESVAEFETSLINSALEKAQFKQTNAAELLGLSYHQLRGLLKKYGLPK